MPQILKSLLFVLGVFCITMVISMLVAAIIRLISNIVQRKPSHTNNNSK